MEINTVKAELFNMRKKKKHEFVIEFKKQRSFQAKIYLLKQYASKVKNKVDKPTLDKLREEYENKKIMFKDYICMACGSKPNVYHHIISLCNGGTNHKHNLLPLCNDCHKLIHDWL